jgi:threonyl-tRNA synthetase
MATIDDQRHSLSHLLAMALLKIRPNSKLGIGPVIENGFYYDFDLVSPLVPEDLPRLENAMRELIKADLPFSSSTLPIAEALAWANQEDAIYKRELIEDLAAAGESEVSFFQTGDSFKDLCKGPHVARTGQITTAFSLTHMAGAYWRGDERRPMLTRIYGVAFASVEDLADWQKRQEEAAARDHRKLGQELDLFTFSPLVGSGLPLFTPKGTRLRDRLTTKIMSLQEPKGYERVNIPHIAKKSLYETSGHWAKFQEDLFKVRGSGEEDFCLKPMNCPHHTQIYASRPRSYRDLPIRYCEVTTCYRDEQAGELHGLTRVRSLTQDDGHAFCMPEQVGTEVSSIFDIIEQFYGDLKMELRPRLSISDPANMDKYLGEEVLWKEAESTLKTLLEERYGEDYDLGVGEAAFYGPKVDFMCRDAIGRWWQLATVQLDFNLPVRFGLEYTDRDGQLKRPVMIHRAVMGSLERFLAVIIEHFAGRFPFWLSPEQVRILPIADRHFDFAHEVAAQLTAFSVTVDDSQEKLGYKIRAAETQKIPVTLVVGDKEVDEKKVSLRWRSDLEGPESASLDELSSVLEKN